MEGIKVLAGHTPPRLRRPRGFGDNGHIAKAPNEKEYEGDNYTRKHSVAVV